MQKGDFEASRMLSMYLRKINIGIRRQMDKSEVKHQMDNATGMHGYIVGYLKSREDEDVYQRDVEKRFSMRRSTASSILALMEKNGLIVRVPVPCDARLKKIVLTEKSQEYISRFENDGKTLERVLTTGFTDEELSCLIDMLARVSSNLEKANEEL